MPNFPDLYDKGTTAFSKAEVAEKIVKHCFDIAQYWASQNVSKAEACEGVAFSILAALDGASLALPAFDLSPSPAEEDKKYHQENGERWYEPEIINDDISLHDLFSKLGKQDA